MENIIEKNNNEEKLDKFLNQKFDEFLKKMNIPSDSDKVESLRSRFKEYFNIEKLSPLADTNEKAVEAAIDLLENYDLKGK